MVLHFWQHGDSALAFSGVMPRLIMRPYWTLVIAHVIEALQRRHLLFDAVIVFTSVAA